MEFILKVTAAALKWSISSEAILTLMESNLQKEISHNFYSRVCIVYKIE